MRHSIKCGKYFTFVDLTNDTKLLGSTFYICWVSGNTINTNSSKDYNVILKVLREQRDTLVFLELHSIVGLDNINREVKDYRLIIKPGGKDLNIVSYLGMKIASSFWKPDNRTDLFVSFHFLTIDNILFQKICLKFLDRSFYNLTTNQEFEISNLQNSDKLKELEMPHKHPIQQLFFLLKQFDKSRLQKEVKREPITEFLELYFEGKKNIKFQFEQLDKLECEKFFNAYLTV